MTAARLTVTFDAREPAARPPGHPGQQRTVTHALKLGATRIDIGQRSGGPHGPRPTPAATRSG